MQGNNLYGRSGCNPHNLSSDHGTQNWRPVLRVATLIMFLARFENLSLPHHGTSLGGVSSHPPQSLLFIQFTCKYAHRGHLTHTSDSLHSVFANFRHRSLFTYRYYRYSGLILDFYGQRRGNKSINALSRNDFFEAAGYLLYTCVFCYSFFMDLYIRLKMFNNIISQTKDNQNCLLI